MSTKYPVYQPLDPSKSQIRLLEVLDGDEVGGEGGESQWIRCRLSTVSLDDDPDFCALSYYWGDPSVTRPISIVAMDSTGCETDEVTVEVTRTTNLEAALRKVRGGASDYLDTSPKTFRVWADAICINQEDVDERGLQVQMMGRIYTSAKLVIAWLGPTDFTLAFKALKTINRKIWKTKDEDFDSLEWMKPYPDLCGLDSPPSRAESEVIVQVYLNGTAPLFEETKNKTWDNIHSLFLHPHWDRVWILQEMVLAKRLVFLTSGNGSISWSKLCRAALRMDYLRQTLKKKLEPRPSWVSAGAWSYISDDSVVAWSGVSFAHITREFIDDDDDSGSDELGSRLLAWFAIILGCMRLKATEPLDQVYGFLGIHDIGVTPDYSGATSVSQLYLEFTASWIQLNHELLSAGVKVRRKCALFNPLWFLNFAGLGRGASNESSNLPSWVPNLHFHAHNFWNKYFTEECAADKAIFSDKEITLPTVHDKSLFVQGVEVDEVSCVYEPFKVEPGNPSFLEFVHEYLGRPKTYPSGITSHEALIRLLFKDCASCSRQPSVYKALGLIHLVHFVCITSIPGPAHDFFDHLQLLGWTPEDDAESFNSWFTRHFFPQMDLEVLGFNFNLLLLLSGEKEEFEDVVWGRAHEASLEFRHDWSIFETDNGYLGLAPPSTEPGDRVCILDGNTIPVILRKMSAADGEYYSFVGTCFVVGLMDGEASELVNSGKVKVESVELR